MYRYPTHQCTRPARKAAQGGDFKWLGKGIPHTPERWLGALAFAREVPQAEMHLLRAGHCTLDEKVEMVAMLMQRFLARLR
jgi:hypothetical protein